MAPVHYWYSFSVGIRQYHSDTHARRSRQLRLDGRDGTSHVDADCTAGRPYFPHVWATVEVFHAEHVVGNGSFSKLVVGGRTRVSLPIHRCCAQHVHTTRVCNHAGLMPMLQAHHNTPHEHACRFIPCLAP